MMGLAVAVTVVCRRSKDASVWEIGVDLVGRREVSGDGRRGARFWSEGKRERSSCGCRSSEMGIADDGWRGGMVPRCGPGEVVQTASSFCAQAWADGAVVVKTE